MYSASLVASTVCGCEIPDMEPLKAFLRRRRNEMGLSQAAFAKLAGVEAHTIWQIEKGATKSPKSDTVQGLARALSIPPEQVVLMLRDENLRAADDHALLDDGVTRVLVPLDEAGKAFVAGYKTSGMNLGDYFAAQLRTIYGVTVPDAIEPIDLKQVVKINTPTQDVKDGERARGERRKGK